jgi:hypothetical protein
MDSAIYLMPDNASFAIFVNSLKGTGPNAGTGPTHLAAIPELIPHSAEFAAFSWMGP